MNKDRKVFITIGSIIILLISFIAFVMPQIGSSNDGSRIVLGKYGEKEITYEQNCLIVENYSNLVNQYKALGYPINNIEYQIQRQAFEQAICQTAYMNYVNKSGYTISDAMVNREIRKNFLNSEGKFDSDTLKFAKNEDIINAKESIKRNLSFSRLTTDLLGTKDGSTLFGTTNLYGTKVSDQEIDFINSLSSDKRGFNMVYFENASYPDSEVIEYAKKNAAKFNKYDLEMICFKNKAKAVKIAEKLAAGEITFEDAAKDNDNLKKYVGDDNKLILNEQYKIESLLENKDELKSVIDISKDAVSPIVQFNDNAGTEGFAIFKKVGDDTITNIEDENTIKDIKDYIKSYEVALIEEYFEKQAQQFKVIADKDGFDAACQALNVTKEEVSPFPINYGGVSIIDGMDTSINGLQTALKNENFIRTAFSLKLNEVSKPIIFNDGTVSGIVVIQYTTNEGASEILAKSDFISTLDNQSCTKAILSSPKVVDTYENIYKQ